VIRNALAVYNWFVRQAITGRRVVVRGPSGEEVTLETAELAVLAGKGNKAGPEELRLFARELAEPKDPAEAARLRERRTRGFYGNLTRGIPAIRHRNVPPALFQQPVAKVPAG
jgi:hypothetical protein